MKVLSLDYGSANTGAAISDPSGTIVRPLDVISDAGSEAGMERIAELVAEANVDIVIVGMPVSLSGVRGPQARETAGFIEALRQSLKQPVYEWDERFTSKLAAEKGRNSQTPSHSLAACCLLEDYLESDSFRKLSAAEEKPGGAKG